MALGVSSSNAFLGESSIQRGFPSQRSQEATIFLPEGIVTAPNLHASMHQLHPIHLSSSALILPVVEFCVKAFLGQEITQGAPSQNRQATAASMNGSILATRIRDFFGSKLLLFLAEHANSRALQTVLFFLLVVRLTNKTPAKMRTDPMTDSMRISSFKRSHPKNSARTGTNKLEPATTVAPSFLVK